MCLRVERYWSITLQKRKWITFKYHVNKQENMLMPKESDKLDLFKYPCISLSNKSILQIQGLRYFNVNFPKFWNCSPSLNHLKLLTTQSNNTVPRALEATDISMMLVNWSPWNIYSCSRVSTLFIISFIFRMAILVRHFINLFLSIEIKNTL